VDVSAAGETLLPPAVLGIVVDRGRFRPTPAVPPGVSRRVRYRHGFSSQIGAGPYERRSAAEDPLPQPVPVGAPIGGGGTALQAALTALGPAGSVQIGDSLTYTTVANLAGITDVLLQATPQQRPVVRINGGAWTIDAAAGGNLAIEGLLVSGTDIVLRGVFDTVTFACCTFDPGEEIGSAGGMPQSVDGRALMPATVWIEGTVAHLDLRRTICGPIRTRAGGAVDRITATDSIVQGVRTSEPGGRLTAANVFDPQRLLRLIRGAVDPVSSFLLGALPAGEQAALAAYNPTTLPSAALVTQIAGALDAILAAGSIYNTSRFAGVPLPPGLKAEAEAGPPPAEAARVNRLLAEAAYPLALAPAAIACAGGDVEIARTTALGQVHAHRISASESILYGFAVAEDAQEGCVRFTAYVEGSALDQPYESVVIADRASIFVSVRFGQPEYAQLGLLADRELLSAGTIREGAKNGSEMGAFSRELNAVKEQGLRLKLHEFMPIGLTPVLVFVT
jgi:hypothetical protein